MLDGIYSIVFRGADDFGMGILILNSGNILGADVGGIQYDGKYSESNDVVEVDLTMTVPPGATLVQGTKAQSLVYTIPVKTTVPKNAFEQNQPVLLQLPPGPVNVIFRRLRKL